MLPFSLTYFNLICWKLWVLAGLFWSVLVQSGLLLVFWLVLACSCFLGLFWPILTCFGMFQLWHAVGYSGLFWSILNNSHHSHLFCLFWPVAAYSGMFCSVPLGFILTCSGLFWPSLACSGLFWPVVNYSGPFCRLLWPDVAYSGLYSCYLFRCL